MSVNRRQFVIGTGLGAAAAALSRGALAAVPAATPAKSEVRSKEVQSAPGAASSFRPHDWASVRAQFRLSPDYAHLSNFFIVSHPAPVREAIDRYRKALDENPFGYLEEHMFEDEGDMLWRKVTAAAAEYIGGKPEEIALTGSTTMGLALVYNGLRLRPGQEILATTHDHYSHHEAIRLAADRWGALTRRVPLYDVGTKVDADEIVHRLASAVTPRTRVVGVTWVHSSSGVRLPIRRIADALGEINRNRDAAERALLVVDGAHGFGCVDENVASLGCDFFSSGTHKWIFAPRGTGLVWAPAANWALLQPTIPSFMSMTTYNAWADGHAPAEPTTASDVSPGGFFAYEHQWAAVEAFGFHQKIGRAAIAARIAELNSRIKDGLAKTSKVILHTPKDPALSAGINCFEIEGLKPQEVVRKLHDRRIIASTSPYKVTYPRLSAGIMNTPEEVDRALAAVRALTA